MTANREAMERGFDAFSRGDFEACLTTIHPEIEWHVAFRLPDLPIDREVYRGHDEVRQLWDAFRSVWEELTLDPEEILYDEDDLLIVTTRFHARGGTIGIELDRVLFYVLEMRDQTLLRIRPFETRAQAFKAAGREA